MAQVLLTPASISAKTRCNSDCLVGTSFNRISVGTTIPRSPADFTFVRDLYGVALRTLADGVLYAAGWDGRGRADFMYTRGRHLERLFGNRFTRA
jgi:hypothetical protein